jgi:mono/diheme cytochrome c family protein
LFFVVLGSLGRVVALGSAPAEAASPQAQVLVDHGLVSQAAADGADLFFRATFGGNGRTCSTCHRVDNNMGLDVEFIASLPPDDKLFIAEHPASEGGVPGLERPQLMRAHGQILMNSDGFEQPTTKFVMRAAPQLLSLVTSIASPISQEPVQRTGWGGDAAPGNGALRLLPIAAVKQHFTRSLDRREGTDFVLPTDAQLDRLETFLLSLGRLGDIDLARVSLTDAGARTGMVPFQAVCSGCHFNAGATFRGGNININSGVEDGPDPSQATEPHPHDGGFRTADKANRDCDGDGVNDCFGDGSFNVPPLIEAADTEPFFHNHSAATIEDAVRFYTTDKAFVGAPLPLSETDVQNIAALLRVLNAALNSALSIQRSSAALVLETSHDDGARETVDTLLALSNSEAADAIEVLSARELNPKTVKLLQRAVSKTSRAMTAKTASKRQALIRGALNDLRAAKAGLGSGLDFVLGEGNLLY